MTTLRMFLAADAFRQSARGARRGRLRVLSNHADPPSPTQKPLAGMHASAAAAERVFSAQPIVQETESARGTDEKDEVYGGLLLKATPPKKSVRSPGLLDNATVGGAEQWIKGGDSESEEESPVLSANTKAYVEDSFVEGQPRSAVQGYRFGLGQLLRGRVRPMAGDSPSGERLAGQTIRPCF